MKKLLLVTASLFISTTAWAFPLDIGPAPAPRADQQALAADFDGIVALNNCSGSLVRFDNSRDTDRALVLTNGHCVDLIPFGEIITNQRSFRSFTLLNATGGTAGRVRARQLVYATMTDTDLAVYELWDTYERIESRFRVRPLTLGRDRPTQGTSIDVVSGFWKRIYSCDIESFAFELQEGEWTFLDSIRYSRPGCDVIGGTSGSPIIERDTRTVVGINNSVNEGGEECSQNNPCEIDENGDVLAQAGFGYAQQTYLLYTCLNSARRNRHPTTRLPIAKLVAPTHPSLTLAPNTASPLTA